jgi:hypothetical protein
MNPFSEGQDCQEFQASRISIPTVPSPRRFYHSLKPLGECILKTIRRPTARPELGKGRGDQRHGSGFLHKSASSRSNHRRSVTAPRTHKSRTLSNLRECKAGVRPPQAQARTDPSSPSPAVCSPYNLQQTFHGDEFNAVFLFALVRRHEISIAHRRALRTATNSLPTDEHPDPVAGTYVLPCRLIPSLYLSPSYSF